MYFTKIFNFLKKGQSDWKEIIAIGVSNIGWKPSIEHIRFKRLTQAFNIPSHQVENGQGNIGLLIGLKQQSLLAHRIAKFESEKYPEVGIYSSPVWVNKYMFVGTDGRDEGPSVNFSVRSYENQLKHYLEAEALVQIPDLQCLQCSQSLGCNLCRAQNSAKSMKEFEETEIIRKAIEVKPDPARPGKKYIFVEYPAKEGRDLSTLYTARNSNEAMAKASSVSLHKRLSKAGLLTAFDEQIKKALSSEHMITVTDSVKAEHAQYPSLFQLINYVLKPSSASTKVRIVTNSSMSRIGGSLNENICTGGGSLNSSLAVLNRFSAFGAAILTDVTEAYRSVRTGPRTNSVRRFYWYNNANDTESLQEFMMTRMTFGDSAAACILSEGTNIISEDVNISPATKTYLQESVYVDDGGESSNSIEKLEQISGELRPVLDEYGWKLKHILKSYAKSEGVTMSESLENILGLAWDFEDDTIRPHLEVFLSKKKRGIHLDEPISVDLAERVLGDIVHNNESRPITPGVILDATSDMFGYDVDELKGKRRHRSLVQARQISMYVVRELTDLSYPAIAREFGGRDHTTVMHAVEKVGNQMAERRQVYDQVSALISDIKSN